MPEGIPEGIIRIVIGLTALIAGWAIGFFDSKLRADKKIRSAEEKAQLAIQQAKGEAERAVLTARSEAAAAKPVQTGRSLLRVWVNAAQRPALDLDGQTVETAPLSEPNRKRLLNLLTIIRPWLEGKTTAAAVPPAVQAVPLVSPSPSTQVNAVPSTRPTAPVTKDEKPAAPSSIVEQIDEILQARLAGSPLADRSIRLQESAEGGVIVWVGMQKFAGVNDVANPEVQAVIRAAIAEWEKKYTPG